MVGTLSSYQQQLIRGELLVLLLGPPHSHCIGICVAAQLLSWLLAMAQVTLLLRDPYLCKDINQLHCNTRYLKVGCSLQSALRAVWSEFVTGISAGDCETWARQPDIAMPWLPLAMSFPV